MDAQLQERELRKAKHFVDETVNAINAALGHLAIEPEAEPEAKAAAIAAARELFPAALAQQFRHTFIADDAAQAFKALAGKSDKDIADARGHLQTVNSWLLRVSDAPFAFVGVHVDR